MASQAADGGTLVATTSHLNESNGALLGQHVSLYASTVPLTVGKQVACLTLPDDENLHLFAATIS